MGFKKKEVSICALCWWWEEIVRCRVTAMFDFVCDECFVSRLVAEGPLKDAPAAIWWKTYGLERKRPVSIYLCCCWWKEVVTRRVTAVVDFVCGVCGVSMSVSAALLRILLEPCDRCLGTGVEELSMSTSLSVGMEKGGEM